MLKQPAAHLSWPALIWTILVVVWTANIIGLTKANGTLEAEPSTVLLTTSMASSLAPSIPRDSAMIATVSTQPNFYALSASMATRTMVESSLRIVTDTSYIHNTVAMTNGTLSDTEITSTTTLRLSITMTATVPSLSEISSVQTTTPTSSSLDSLSIIFGSSSSTSASSASATQTEEPVTTPTSSFSDSPSIIFASSRSSPVVSTSVTQTTAATEIISTPTPVQSAPTAISSGGPAPSITSPSSTTTISPLPPTPPSTITSNSTSASSAISFTSLTSNAMTSKTVEISSDTPPAPVPSAISSTAVIALPITTPDVEDENGNSVAASSESQTMDNEQTRVIPISMTSAEAPEPLLPRAASSPTFSAPTNALLGQRSLSLSRCGSTFSTADTLVPSSDSPPPSAVPNTATRGARSPVRKVARKVKKGAAGTKARVADVWQGWLDHMAVIGGIPL